MSTNKNNDYEEVDNSSETSKDYPSSNSSVDDTKKRTSFEDNKEEKNKDKRSKRNSFISIFKKDDKEKEEKEKPHSEGLSRSLSGIFNNHKDKDKDKEKEEKEKSHSEGLSRSISGIFNKDKDKRTSTVESEKIVRPSSNSDKSKNRRSFIFFSDDDDKLDVDNAKRGSKSRQNSNPDGVEKDKSTKLGNRISVNIGNIGKFFENKPSHKQNGGWDDHFIGPGEAISPKSPRTTSFSISPLKNKSISNNTSPEYVESPKSLTGTGINGVNKPVSYLSRDDTSKDQRDDVQSTNSSTRTSSVDDQNEISFNDKNSTPPTTPRLLVTHPDLDSTVYYDPNESKYGESQQSKKDDDNDIKQDAEQNNVIDSKIESKSESKTKLHKNVEPLFISTKNLEQRPQNDATVNDTSSLSNNEQVLKKLQELEETKLQLEAKVAEQDIQINKFNSMEQIMQQQIDLSKRMAETIHRLESKVNVQKETDGTNVGKTLEDTVKRLEHKVCQQSEELNDLKSIVSQLGGENSQLAIMGIPHEMKSLIMAPHERESNHYSGSTLVDTLVVKPFCNTVAVSAGIAVSVLYAVYVRPVIGLIKVVKVARGGT